MSAVLELEFLVCTHLQIKAALAGFDHSRTGPGENRVANLNPLRLKML
jgi:hypothetical protein